MLLVASYKSTIRFEVFEKKDSTLKLVEPCGYRLHKILDSVVFFIYTPCSKCHLYVSVLHSVPN
jgi:hypothetical protein